MPKTRLQAACLSPKQPNTQRDASFNLSKEGECMSKIMRSNTFTMFSRVQKL